MNLEQIIQSVKQLPPDQVRQLRHYLNELVIVENPSSGKKLDMAALRLAINNMRSGLSETKINEIADAMNEEYIESVSDDEWDL